MATGPGTVKLDNPPGTHDDQAVAVALAAAQLLERPTSQPGRFGGLLAARTSLLGAYGESVLSVGRPEPLGRSARADQKALERDRFGPWRLV